MTRPDVVVVGGGMTGLVAARRLRLSGADVMLVELSPRLGGVVQTRRDHGYLVEEGPDGFVAAKGSVLRLAAELGIADEVVDPLPTSEGAQIWWEGRLHDLPGGLLLMVPSRLRPLLSSSLLSWWGKTRALADLILPRSRTPGDESLESFVTRRLGREVLERVAQPLVAGIHGARPDTMSLAASFPRLLEMERRHRSLIRAARAAAAASPRGGGPSYFASFEQGMGRLIEALTGDLGGVVIRTGSAAVSLSRGTHSYRVGLSDGELVSSDAVILAVPATVAAGLLVDLAPDAADRLAGIGQVPSAAVTFAFATDRLPSLRGSGFLVPAAQRRRLTGVSYLSRKWPGRVPDEGHTLIRAFVEVPPGVGSAPDPDFLRTVAAVELKSMIGISAPPLRTWVSIRGNALHRYEVGHKERVTAVERDLEAFPGLALAGAGFHGIGLNECIDSGERAAAAALVTLGTGAVPTDSHQRH